MYCKKCHKKIINFVKNLHEIRNRCMCSEQRTAKGTENGNHVPDRIYNSIRKKGG